MILYLQHNMMYSVNYCYCSGSLLSKYDVNSFTECNKNVSLNMQVDNSISNDNMNLK